MDPETEKLIEDQMKKLSPELRKLFTEPGWGDKIIEIGKKNGFNVEQLGIFQLETMLVMLGLTHPDDYHFELKDRLNIDDAQAESIVESVNEQVLKGMREKLKLAYEESGDAQKDSDAPTETIQEDEKEILHQAGIKITEPDLSLPELNSGKTHPIFSQKFSNTVHAQTVKVEQTNEPAQTAASEAKKTYPKGGDPYRISPEE